MCVDLLAVEIGFLQSTSVIRIVPNDEWSVSGVKFFFLLSLFCVVIVTLTDQSKKQGIHLVDEEPDEPDHVISTSGQSKPLVIILTQSRGQFSTVT